MEPLIKRCLSIIPILLAFSIPFKAYASEWALIKPDRARLLQKESAGIWLVDVRNPGVFDKGHIEGSINIPAELLKVKQFPKNKRLVLIDDSIDQDSAEQCAKALASKGIKVSILEGGIRNWRSEGFPLTDAIPDIGVVTTIELKTAIEKGIRLTILDLRPEEEFRKGAIPGAVPVKGKDIPEKIFNLKKELKNHGKNGGGLGKGGHIILILPETRHFQIVEQNIRDANNEIRYLLGGFRAWAAMHGGGERKRVGDCPYCGTGSRRQ
ncbi:MAG: hypothetical protein HYV24_02470 [Deltaproteobacteria bacterium]|nr:hypothetical protein [Deltaproteobacteria bacterium]